MQFAGGDSSAGVDLTPPAPVTTEIPPGLKLAPMVISFVLDRTGRVRDLHVLEAHDASLAAQGIAALSHWLFRPALRAGEPLAVNAVIGFGISGN
jgi:hypothetical protein